jgi:hypothetical protein
MAIDIGSRMRIAKWSRRPADVPKALAIIRDGPDREALRTVFGELEWQLTFANSTMWAVTLNHSSANPVVLYERERTQCDWREAVSFLSRLSPRPYVILLSSCYDKNLWDEFVQCGGFEILRTPLDRNSLVLAVASGWRLWRNQRKLLEKSQAMTPLRTA